MKIKHLFLVAICAFTICLVGCKKTEKPKEEENKEHVHTFGEWTIDIEADCLFEGYKTRTCTGCGESESIEIPALGHDFSKTTCMYRSECTRCGTKDEKFAEHAYGEWTIIEEASCQKTGSRVHTCKWCGKEDSELIPSPSHEWSDWKILQNSTCIETGLKEHTCNVGGETVREVIPCIDHEFSEWVEESSATCIKEGSSLHHCLYCNLEEVKVIPCTDHVFEEKEEINATCNHNGLKSFVCNVCNTYKYEEDDVLTHTFKDGICDECGMSEKAYNNIQAVISNLTFEVNLMDGLILLSSLDSVNISWKSLTPNIVLDDGTVFAKYETQKAVLEATFTYNDTTYKKTFNVDIPSINTQSIDECWQRFYSQKLVASTVVDLALLTKNYGPCSVYKYTTSNSDIITEKGRITQRLYNQEATISCYLQIGKTIKKYEKTIEVRSYSNSQRVDLVIEWLDDVIKELQAGTIDTLPTTHELYGTTINWFSLEAGVVAGNGIFVKPTTAKDLTLECTVICNGSSREHTYELKNIGGNMTEKDQLKEWIKGQIPSRIYGTKNFVFEDDSLDYQIRTNSGGILNLINGESPVVDRSKLIDVTKNGWVNKFWGSGSLGTNYHPAVSQEILNDMMYNGYLNPNPQNILWITVHESGMPRAKNDAALLADIQLETARGTRSRQASWNYQVDENKIYQSFEDNIICWHAGDGTGVRGNGNNNSIGIEMCINEDGNYDGAMHHDAKLIAMLLHKYNLTLANIKRHYDWSGKICPNYMITQGRWLEFLSLVDKEYTAMSLLKNASVTWTVTTDEMSDTDKVLDTYFTHAASTIYIAKSVNVKTTLHITMKVEYSGEVFTYSNDLVLYPEK